MKLKRNKKVLVFVLLFFAVVFFIPGNTYAFDISLNVQYPDIPIPGYQNFSLHCLESEVEIEGCPKFTLGVLMIFIFGLFIWIGGLVAFVALIYTGFSYALSGASPQIRNKAKERMKNVFIGLGILLFSTIILNVINPDIGDLEQADMTEQREDLVETQPTVIGDFINFVSSVFTGENAPEVGENGGSPGGGGPSSPPGDLPDPPSWYGDSPVSPENRQLGQNIASEDGWGSGDEWYCLDQLWGHESQWDNTAQNPVSTAYGIPQFLDSTWAGTGYSKTSDPETQIRAGLVYIKNRYDTPCRAWAFWLATHYEDASIAPSDLQGMAQTWINNGYVGY